MPASDTQHGGIYRPSANNLLIILLLLLVIDFAPLTAVYAQGPACTRPGDLSELSICLNECLNDQMSECRY